MKILKTLAIAALVAFSGITVTNAADETTTRAAVLPAKIVFSAGGVEGRYIILESWSSTEDYPINTILKHNSNAWVALTDPAVGDEPGTTAVWHEVTGSGSGGSGGGTIPHVGRIPAVAPDSPDLIFLTHDEFEGNREDATLTIARDGSYCGYSDGSIYPAFGDISEPSPITTIFGIWDATNSVCDLSEVITGNEGWLDDQVQIAGTVSGTDFTCSLGSRFATRNQYAKRFTSCTNLEDLPLGDITINFLNGDTPPDPYWLDGDVRHPAGLYEKVGNPLQYHDIRPIEESHHQGQGSFACGSGTPPDDGGQVCIDSDGRASFSSDRTLVVSTEPEITSTTPLVSDYWTGASNGVLAFNNNGENGEFKWYLSGDIFFQIQGTRATATLRIAGTANTVIPSGTVFDRDGVGTTHIRTLAEATIENDGDVDVAIETITPGATGNNIPPSATFTLEEAITGVDDSAILETGFTGGSGPGLISIIEWTDIWDWISGIDDSDTAQEQTFHEALRDDSVFLGEFSQQSDAAEDRDGFASATTRYFYILHDEEETIQEITGFTESEETEFDQHEWRGPVVTIEDVHDIFEANSGDDITHALDDFRIGDRVYTVIVRPDPTTGILRDPTANDYEATDAESRVVAVVDGVSFKVKRTLTLGHSAAGTWTELPEFTEFTVDGLTYRYRLPHHGDRNVLNPGPRDFYYDLRGHKWRIHHTQTFGDPFWADLHEGSDLLTIFHWVEFEASEDEALSSATQDGQRFIYPDSNGVYQTFTLSDFTAGAPEHYTYYWAHGIKTPVPLPAIIASFPTDGDTATNESFYAVRDGEYNTQVGYTARSHGDVWVMDSARIQSSFQGVPDVYGYQTGTDSGGTLTPSPQFSQIIWRDVQGNPSQVRVRVHFTSTTDLHNLSSVSDGDIRIRYQSREEDYHLPDESGWFSHTMDRFGGGQHAIWQTEVISTNPFREGQESWIAFEVQVSGEWQRLTHDSLNQYLALIDQRDLSHETPTSTNTGAAAFGTSENVAREDHQHGGPPMSVRRYAIDQQNHLFDTGIHMRQGTLFFVVADQQTAIYTFSYQYLLDQVANHANPGDTPDADNSHTPGGGTSINTNVGANFTVSHTSPSGSGGARLLIGRNPGNNEHPNHITITAFNMSGASDSGNLVHFVGDDAFPWATEGNQDPIPASKLTNAPSGAGDITSITTPANSGVELDGCDTGGCGISLDIPSLLDLPATLADSDEIIVSNDSEANDPERKENMKEVANYVGEEIAGSNLTWNSTTNQLDATGGSITVNPTGVATATAEKFESGGTVYNAGKERIFTTGVTYGSDFNSHVVIAAAGYTPAVGDVITFQHNTDDDANYLANQRLELEVGDEGAIRTRIHDKGVLRDIIMTDLVRYEWLTFVRAGSFWHLLYRTYQTNASRGARVVRTTDFNVAADTVTAVPVTSQSFDECDCWESGANNTRVTINEGITRAKVWAGTALSSPTENDSVSVFIRRNGSEYISMNEVVVPPGNNNPAAGASASTGLISVSDNDYFELVVHDEDAITLLGTSTFLAIEVH